MTTHGVSLWAEGFDIHGASPSAHVRPQPQDPGAAPGSDVPMTQVRGLGCHLLARFHHQQRATRRYGVQQPGQCGTSVGQHTEQRCGRNDVGPAMARDQIVQSRFDVAQPRCARGSPAGQADHVGIQVEADGVVAPVVGQARHQARAAADIEPGSSGTRRQQGDGLAVQVAVEVSVLNVAEEAR